jgi:gliding motility-associated-like protein
MVTRKLLFGIAFLSTLLTTQLVFAQLPTNSDCFGAIPVCQSSYYFNSSVHGEGNYIDIPDQGDPSDNFCPGNCISDGEQNTTWFIFTTQSAGLLNFTIAPLSGSDDYDWAVYNITTGDCSNIYAGGMQVSCNYCMNTGSTGANGGSPYWCWGPSGCSSYNAPIPVGANETYVLMVDNFSASNNGYNLDFSASTASIVDNSAPQLVSLVTPLLCGASQLSISFSENINCNSITNSDFTITGPGGPYSISYIAGANCLNGGAQEEDFILTVMPSLSTGGSFNLNILSNAVSDACGNLSAATSIPFTINAPNVAITPSSGSYCGSGSVLLTASGANTYQWTPSTGLSGTTVPVVTASPSSTTTYTCYGVIAGCTDAEGVTITVNPFPNVSISQSPAGAQCTGTSITLTGNSSIPGTTYQWSSGGSGNSTVVNPGTTTVYTVTGTSPSPASCSSTATITVVINPLPTVTLAPLASVCLNQPPFSLTGGSPAGGTYSGTGVSGGVFDPSAAGVGTHTITYTYTDGNTCTNSAQRTITVNANADATVNPAGPFCLTDAALNLSPVNPGGVWSGTGITNTVNGTFDPATAGLGTHTITYIIAGVCPDTGTISIIVTNQADATITAAGPYCESDAALNLNAATPGGSWSGNGITNATNGTFDPATAGVGTHTIVYTIGGNCGDVDSTSITILPQADASINAAGPFCVSDAAVTLSSAESGGTWSGTGITNGSTGTFDPSVAGVGSHTITYGITGQCGDTATLVIQVNDQFDATIDPAGPFCENGPAITLTAADNGGIWSGTGITNTANGTFAPAIAGSGNHEITYTISGSCGDADSINISVIPAPVLTMAGTAESCMGAADGTASTTISSGTPPYVILWNTTSTSPSISALAPGVYTVVVTDDQGCSNTAFFQVDSSFTECETIIPTIYIPNIFSPNGDLVNDVLYVRGQGILEINFSIYDRWGEELFNTKDLATGWDGTYKGKNVDPAVFVWHLKATFVNGEFIERTGNLSLMR